MRIQSLLDRIDRKEGISEYEKYEEKKELINRLMDREGIDNPSQRDQIESNWVGPDPIATQGGFFDRLGRSASRGVDQLQMNIGAIGEYAGELTGIDALREASGDLYEEQKRQMDAQAPAFQSIEQEGSTGFLDRIDDYANMAVESGIGSAPIAIAPALLAASAPATLTGGILAGTATAVATNAALEGGSTYSEQSRNDALGRSDDERRAKALAQANRVAIAQGTDPELLANSILSSIPVGKALPKLGFMGRLGTGAVQQSGLEAMQEGRQYEVSEEARGREVSRFDPEGVEQMIVGGLTGAPATLIDASFDSRVDADATEIQLLAEQALQNIEKSNEQMTAQNRTQVQEVLERIRLRKAQVDLNSAELALEEKLEAFLDKRRAKEEEGELSVEQEEEFAQDREELQETAEEVGSKARSIDDLKKSAASEKKAEKAEEKRLSDAEIAQQKFNKSEEKKQKRLDKRIQNRIDKEFSKRESAEARKKKRDLIKKQPGENPVEPADVNQEKLEKEIQQFEKEQDLKAEKKKKELDAKKQKEIDEAFKTREEPKLTETQKLRLIREESRRKVREDREILSEQAEGAVTQQQLAQENIDELKTTKPKTETKAEKELREAKEKAELTAMKEEVFSEEDAVQVTPVDGDIGGIVGGIKGETKPVDVADTAPVVADEGATVKIYHGGKLDSSERQSGDLLFTATDRKQSAAYAEENQGEVSEYSLNKEDIVDESAARALIKELKIKPKNKGWKAEESSLYELLDPQFEQFVGDKNVNRFKKEMLKRGYKAISFKDEDITATGTGRQTAENIVVLDKSVLGIEDTATAVDPDLTDVETGEKVDLEQARLIQEMEQEAAKASTEQELKEETESVTRSQTETEKIENVIDKAFDENQRLDQNELKLLISTASKQGIDVKGKSNRQIAEELEGSLQFSSFTEVEPEQTRKLTKREVGLMAKTLKGQFKSSKDIIVYKDDAEASAAMGSAYKPSEGFVKDGQVYLVANNLRGKNTQEAVQRGVQVYFHEAIGHDGLQKFMDRNGGFDNFLDAFGKNTRNKAGLNKWLKTEKGKRYNEVYKGDQKKLLKEYIAINFAEKGLKSVTMIERVGEAIRRVMGIKGSETALKQALQNVKTEMQRDGNIGLFEGMQQALGRTKADTDERVPGMDTPGTTIDFGSAKTEEAVFSLLNLDEKPVYPIDPKTERVHSIEEAKNMGGIKADGKRRMNNYLDGVEQGRSPQELISEALNDMMKAKDDYDATTGSSSNSSFNPNKYSKENVVVRLHLGGDIKVDGKVVGKGYTAHPVSKNGTPIYNKALFYGPGFNIIDGTLDVNQQKRRDIAVGETKSGRKQDKVPMAGVQGKLANTPLSTEGIQLAFNPKREHVFIEKSSGIAVKGFKGEASVIGGTVYVRGELEYYNKDTMPAPVDGVASEAIADNTIAEKEAVRYMNDNDIQFSFMDEVISAANPKVRQSFVERAKSTGQVIAKYSDAAVNPVALIPMMEKYLAGRNKVKGRIDRLSELGKQIYDTLNKASKEESTQIYEYLTTRDADPNSITNDSLRDTAVEVKRAIERIGDQAVNSGLLAKAQVDALRGQYLPRVYLKYLLDESNSAFNQVLRSDLKVDGGWFTGRKEIEESIRKLFLGEIEDPAFLAQKGIVTAGRDLAIVDFMDWISENDQWAYAPQFTEYDTKNRLYELAGENDRQLATSLVQDFGLTPNDKPMRVTPNYLLKEGQRIKQTLAMHQDNGGLSNEKSQLMNLLADDMMKRGNEVLYGGEGEAGVRETAEAEGFVQMPDLKKYGKLRGMYVRPEIKEDLVGTQTMSEDSPNWLRNLIGEGGTIAKYGSIFKLTKTALNFPAGHMRNFVSALSLAYFSDVPMTKLPGLVGRAFKEMRTKGTYYNIAKDRGLMAAGFIAEEVKRVETEYMNSLKKSDAKTPFGKMLLSLQLAASRIGNKAGDVYQYGDEINRLIVLIDQMENKGATADQAAVHANKWIMDYSLVRNWVKYGRTAVIGAPFLTFTAKVVPLMLETAVTKPTKFLLPYAIGHGMMEFTKSQFDWDDEDVEAHKMALADYLRTKANAGLLPPAIIPVPWKDAEGRIQFWDASYVYPWGIINELWSELSEGELGEAVRTLGVMGGPLTQTISAITSNRDPFTQREIVEPWMEPFDQISAWTEYTWNMMSPPFLHYQFGAFPRMFRIGDLKEGTGDPEKTAGQVAGQLVGFNLTAVDPKSSRERNIKKLNRELSDIRSEQRKTVQYYARNKRYDKMREAQKEFRERLERKRKEIQDYKKVTSRVLR